MAVDKAQTLLINTYDKHLNTTYVQVSSNYTVDGKFTMENLCIAESLNCLND